MRRVGVVVILAKTPTARGESRSSEPPEPAWADRFRRRFGTGLGSGGLRESEREDVALEGGQNGINRPEGEQRGEIVGREVVEYNPLSFRSIDQAKERIGSMIRNGLREQKNDSPVHAVLDLNIGSDSQPILETRKIEYALKSKPTLKVGLITGDLQNVKGIDVWVNPENQYMEMSRPLENTISGIIRHLGRTKEGGNVVDKIQILLLDEMSNRKKNTVEAAEVVVTEPGGLASREVKKIFHVASIYGEPGQGYFPIQNVSRCVRNVLERFNDQDCKGFSTILIPLMGVRARRRPLESQIKPLLDEAINFLTPDDKDDEREDQSVYFLVYDHEELEASDGLLHGDDRLVLMTGPLPDLRIRGEAPFQAPVANLAPLEAGAPVAPLEEALAAAPAPKESKKSSK